MSANKLCGRVDNDVGTVFYWTNKEWGAKRVVDDNYGIMAMCNFSNAVDVGDTSVRISEGLDDDGLGVWAESLVNGFKVSRIDNCGFHSLCRQRVFHEVVCSSIEIVSRYDVVAIASHVLKSIGDGSGARCDSKSCHAPLKCSHTVFKHTLSRVGQSPVDISSIAKTESVGCML